MDPKGGWPTPGVLGPQKIRNKCSGPDLVSGSHWPNPDRKVRVFDLSLAFLAFLGFLTFLGFLAFFSFLAFLTPLLAKHYCLWQRRRLKSTEIHNHPKKTCKRVFLSYFPTVHICQLMVKLFLSSCAALSLVKPRPTDCAGVPPVLLSYISIRTQLS